MIVGGYSLHLYCRECNVFGEFSGYTKGYCWKDAKKAGWKRTKTDVVCRACK